MKAKAPPITQSTFTFYYTTVKGSFDLWNSILLLCLTLEEHVKVIKLLESGKSSRTVADEVGVGHAQIQNLFKWKREILDEYENNGNHDMKQPCRATEYDEIKICYKWMRVKDMCQDPYWKKRH